jgi:hypothetical protein
MVFNCVEHSDMILDRTLPLGGVCTRKGNRVKTTGTTRGSCATAEMISESSSQKCPDTLVEYLERAYLHRSNEIEVSSNQKMLERV